MKVISIDSPAKHAVFLKLPAMIGAADPGFIPEPAAATRAALDVPEYRGRQAAFLVCSGDTPLARCVARYGANNVGTIGFFAAQQDVDVCRLLLEAACNWLREQGATRVLGPMDGDTWHPYRFNLGPYDKMPFLKEPWNPPWYPAMWESCGFAEMDRYYSALMPDPARTAEAFAPFLQRVRRQGYTFRPFRKEAMAEELDVLYALSLEIFPENRHYTPISREAFHALYAGAGPLINPAFCQYCCNAAGKEIGYVFAYPDVAEAVRAMRGKQGLLAKLRFLTNRSRADRVCIKTLGCIPACQGKGVAPALMAVACEAAANAGYAQALMCLMHAGNDSRRLDAGTSELFREYALYVRDLRVDGGNGS